MWGRSGLLPRRPCLPFQCPKHRKRQLPAVHPVLQEEDLPPESSSMRQPSRPFSNKQAWSPPTFAQSRQLRAKARTGGHAGLIPQHPCLLFQCPKHCRRQLPAVQPVLQEEDSPMESSSLSQPVCPFPNERPWPAVRSVVHQCPRTLLQAERRRVGLEPSRLHQPRRSLKHERSQGAC